MFLTKRGEEMKDISESEFKVYWKEAEKIANEMVDKSGHNMILLLSMAGIVGALSRGSQGTPPEEICNDICFAAKRILKD